MTLTKRQLLSKNGFPSFNNTQFGLIAVALAGCGGAKTNGSQDNYRVGFSSDYRPPTATYNPPADQDPNFKINEPNYITPYWVDALLMDNGQSVVDEMLSINDNTILFVFPTEKPVYIPIEILGWMPANEKMQIASRQIFNSTEQVLNIKFEEANNVYGLNVVVVSQSIQSGTAGFSYFPNTYYELGSDVFLSRTYSNPHFLSNGLTNYDYEILLHEIGHALGLKHPFEGDGSNDAVLTVTEDNTTHTGMSYDDYSFSFDGTFRALDWMALTKLYGVNASYASGNDTYKFSQAEGIFIIDGAGIDTIDCTNSTLDVFLDLRPGAHSYQGNKSSFITTENQLTISHGSDIENVKTGSGNDTVIANDLDNFVSTLNGNDTIFAGNGVDIIAPGLGEDIIDLSEDVQSEDTLILDIISTGQNAKIVYGFEQGADGDVIKFNNLGMSGLNFLPLVDSSHVPIGYIDNCLVRIVGDKLNSVDDLKNHFSEEGLLQNLKLSKSEFAILISSNSQDTGEVQNLYSLTNQTGDVEIIPVGEFLGNYLDIDNWVSDNFLA